MIQNHFNSIKVRLEPVLHAAVRLHHLDFNSIKVRLEPKGIMIPISPNKFQFHKGAIRTFRVHPHIFRTREFQFHKGAIRTRLPRRCAIFGTKFQFHKGAIRTASKEHRNNRCQISIP